MSRTVSVQPATTSLLMDGGCIIPPQSSRTVTIPYCDIANAVLNIKRIEPATQIFSQLRPTEIAFVNPSSDNVRVDFEVIERKPGIANIVKFDIVASAPSRPRCDTPESWKRIYVR